MKLEFGQDFQAYFGQDFEADMYLEEQATTPVDQGEDLWTCILDKFCENVHIRTQNIQYNGSPKIRQRSSCWCEVNVQYSHLTKCSEGAAREDQQSLTWTRTDTSQCEVTEAVGWMVEVVP